MIVDQYNANCSKLIPRLAPLYYVHNVYKNRMKFIFNCYLSAQGLLNILYLKSRSPYFSCPLAMLPSSEFKRLALSPTCWPILYFSKRLDRTFCLSFLLALGRIQKVWLERLQYVKIVCIKVSWDRID